jgi:hypothetical protein
VSLTQSGVIAGTPAYMSPEQARGETLDHRADLFSLGSVLYALCTGHAPFRAASTMDLLRKVCEETPTPVRDVNPNVPEWLAAVIERLHAKDADERFASAQEVADVLDYELNRLAALPGAAPRPKHRRGLWAAVFLLLLLAGGSVLFLTGVWPVPGSNTEREGVTPEGGQQLVAPGDKDPATPAPNPGSPAFAVLARHGRPELRSKTLAGAIGQAHQGDTIEVRGNGPFTEGPIQVGKKNLLIRAATGFAPIIQLDPKSTRSSLRALLTTDGSLVLEGLDLRRSFVANEGYDESLVLARGERFLAANCRFGVRGGGFNLRGTFHRQYEVRNCLLAGDKFAITWIDPPPDGSVRVDNCAIGAERGFLAIVTPALLKGQGAEIRLSRSNWAVKGFSQMTFKAERPEPVAQMGRNPFLWETSENVIDFSSFYAQTGRFAVAAATPLSPRSSEQLLQKWVTLKERANVYGKGEYFLQHEFAGRDKNPGGELKSLAEWRRFWKMSDPEAATGKPRYLGIGLEAKIRAKPETVTPDDFRLQPDSPGWHAGPGGRDRGADLDLVGPGPAYERWKKTAEYQQWQKMTTALVEGPPPLFAILARGGQAEQKCLTLAEAAAAARSGDTIEINGNGPFLTKPVNFGQQSLTLRAGPGFRPLLQRDPADAQNVPLLSTAAPLVLEGLELQNTLHTPLSSTGSLLALAHCRLTQKGLGFGLLYSGAVLELRNTEILCDPWAALSLSGSAAQDVLLDNCLLVGFEAVLPTETTRPGVFPERDIRIRHSTLIANRTAILHCRQYWPLQDGKEDLRKRTKPPLRFHLEENVLEVLGEARNSCGALMLSCHFDESRHKPEELVPLLPLFMSWEEKGNLHGTGNYLTFSDGKGALLPYAEQLTSLASWQKFWKIQAEGSWQEPVHFAGRALDRRLSSGSMATALIHPADFRLAHGSAGQGGGAGNKDLGADVDCLGPGPAYDGWKRTREYPQWLERTRQSK